MARPSTLSMTFLRPARGLIFLMACLLPPLAGQSPPVSLHLGPVYTSPDGKKTPEFPSLEVVVSSSDPQQPAPRPDELTLVEDGVDGPHATGVSPFESKGYGLGAVVAVDVSGSMAGRPLAIIRQSLQKFVSDARPQDAVGVMTIADDAVWDVPFGSDAATMKKQLAALHSRGTQTRLFDGLVTALGRFDATLPARRELTVISDGHDEGSRATLERVVQLARERNIAIDAIGLTRSSPAYLRTLSTLAAQTGGSFHQVHSDRELESLISSGMNRLKATPVATFEAAHLTADGKQHRLGVRWSGKAIAFGETTFLAPERSAAHVLHTIRRLPWWSYALLGGLLVALVGVVVSARRAKKPSRGNVYTAPPPLPPSPAASSPVGSRTSFEGIPLPSPAMRPAEVPHAGREAIVPPSADAKAERSRTRIAGVFPGAGSAIAHLDVLTGPLSGRSVQVAAGQFWIGAAASNQLVLPDDATVSSRHAFLIFEDPILLLVDNHSTNGTRVGGRLLNGTRQPLHNGDQIQIGQTLLRLRSGV